MPRRQQQQGETSLTVTIYPIHRPGDERFKQLQKLFAPFIPGVTDYHADLRKAYEQMQPTQTSTRFCCFGRMPDHRGIPVRRSSDAAFETLLSGDL